jgi:DNA invertase Pin-like site-specific DNA recombinase
MPTSDLITASHLARKALIYIRQSSPHQVLTNQESLQMQYALQERAARLGWRAEDIEVIDTDLGLSGRAAEHRAGFKELAARVTLGQVGIILSTEVNRLSRNCSDWYPLLDSCGYRGCLIDDGDGVYDPATANGRLLLELKGTISEAELFTIRARLTAGLLNKAQRGDLALRLPVGLVRNELGQVEKDPDRAVQRGIELVFTTFLRVRYSPKVLDFFNQRGLKLPRRDRYGELIWRTPNTNMILAILKNPAYAGAFVYGRSRSLRSGAAQQTASQISRRSRPSSWMSTRVPSAPSAKVMSRRRGRTGRWWSGCAIRQTWHSDGSCGSTRITAWWPPNWRRAGKRPPARS